MAALGLGASAQTLAHKNWAGSGISVEPWYQSAVFYQVDPLTFQDSDGDGFGDLPGITARLPYLQQLGVDALVLSPLPLEPPGGARPFDPAYGSAEDFDTLEREANAHHMRVLVDLPLDLPHEQMLATARFWLSRGVAGLRLLGSDPDRVRELQAIAGTRILVTDSTEQAVASRHPAPHVRPEVRFDRRLLAVGTLTPALLRAALAGANLLADEPNEERSLTRLGDGVHDVELAKITAAALLLGRGAPMLYAGQELGMAGAGDPLPMQWDGGADGFTKGTPWIAMGPNVRVANAAAEEADPASLLNWYRRLAEVRHTVAAVRTGTLEVLAVPNARLVAWVRRTRSGPAVLVVANLSPYPTVTPLSSLLPGRHESVTVLARTAGEGNGITLEPFGVWVGELRGAGLETVVLPARGRR
jgi:hypothetical protein